MLPSFCRQTVTRIRPGIKGERGSDVFDWENAESIEIPLSLCYITNASSDAFKHGVVMVSTGLCLIQDAVEL